MKRISIATLTAALVLLSGCNKDRNTIEVPIAPQEDFVRIELGGSNSLNNTTRASLENLDDINRDSTGRIGIFCLAGRKTHISGSSEAKDIDWANIVPTDLESYGENTNGTYWNNVRCRVEGEAPNYRLVPDENQEYYWYYPNTSWYGYDFYGYYPYQYQEGRQFISSNMVTVDLDIDGRQDVIWGYSVDPTAAIFEEVEDQSVCNKLVESYYSARYFRFAPENWTATHMKFKHMLTQFRFHVYPAANKESNPEKKYDTATALKVTELRLEDEVCNLQMVVADRSGLQQGTVYSRDGYTRDFYLHYADGTLLKDSAVAIKTQLDTINDVVIPDTVEMGECIMALAGDTLYHLSVQLQDTVTTYSSEKRIAIRRANGAPFEAGKIYHVYLQVAGVTRIGVTAEMEDWNDTGEQVGDFELQ